MVAPPGWGKDYTVIIKYRLSALPITVVVFTDGKSETAPQTMVCDSVGCMTEYGSLPLIVAAALTYSETDDRFEAGTVIGRVQGRADQCWTDGRVIRSLYRVVTADGQTFEIDTRQPVMVQ